MPEIGEERKAREISRTGTSVYVWSACPDCGAENWRRRQDVSRSCPKCGRRKLGLSKRLIDDREYCFASESGRHPKNDYVVYKDNCPMCEKEMWRERRCIGKPCAKCNYEERSAQMKAQVGEKHPRFKGYRRMHAGYVMVKLPDDHPFRCMASARDGYVLEHRLVMANKIGRPLFPWQIVHHKGIRYPKGSKENKQDNRPENLDLLPGQADHLLTQRFEAMEREIADLKAEVAELKKEDARLGREVGREQIRRIVEGD